MIPFVNSPATFRCVMLLPVLALASAGLTQAAEEQQKPSTLSVPIPLEGCSVSEAPEGASDGNWRVANIVDGAWAEEPFYPDRQWMARHIGEPGYDIWCRVDFGRPRTIIEVDLQNARFPGFVHPKGIRLEFSDGTTRELTMVSNDRRQTFRFPPIQTSWVKIHLADHYGNGTGINLNSGGLAEVEFYEPVDTPKPGHYDLDREGTDDLLVFTWQGHLAAFIADDGSLPMTGNWDRDWDAYFDAAYNVGQTPTATWNPARGNWGSYTLLVDRDDDGDFDGIKDYWYQVVDLDHDGDPDIERTDRYVGWGKLVKYNFDLDDDNLNNNIDWALPGYGDEQAHTTTGNYVSDRAGNGFFLQGWLAMNETSYVDTRAAWENPIAWYDMDDDGATEMVVRVTDTHGRCEGTLMEVEVAFDVDNASNAARQSSLDVQLSWLGHQSRPYDYSHLVEDFPALAGLAGADYLFGRRVHQRRQIQRLYFPYFDAYKLGTELDDCAWNSVFLLVDEDNDDERWEEMFSPHEGYGHEDHLGDRWESDDDYDGKGKLYVGKFDGRIHLYEAERAEWTVDYRTLYKGSVDRPREGPMPPDGLRHALVRYTDTDDNGFIDRITHGEAAWGEKDSFKANRVVNLLDYATPENPHPDVCELFDLKTADPLTNRKVSDWDGKKVAGLRLEAYDRLKGLFEKTARDRWQAAQTLYRAAASAGLLSHEKSPSLPMAAMQVDPADKPALAKLTDVRPGSGYADLLQPDTIWETYHSAYWLAEKVFADLLDTVPDGQRDVLCGLYYAGQLRQLAEEVHRLSKNSQP